MKKEKNILKLEGQFLQVDYSFLRADGFVNNEGEYIPLSWYDIRVYLYVKQKVNFFVQEKKGEYFDTQEAVAHAVGVSYSSARRSFKKFIDNKVIVCFKKKWKNYENYRYVEVKDIVLYKEGEKVPKASSSLSYAKENNNMFEVFDSLEDIEPPF